MKLFRLLGTVLVCVFYFHNFSADADPGDVKSFTILHTNDDHGHLLPFSYPDRVSPTDFVAQMLYTKNIGGIARRATLIKQIRSEEKNVYVFDAGDNMDGTPFSTEFFDAADYAALNAIGYDYGTLGNHEFNMSASHLDALLPTVKFPLLVANVYVRATNKPLLAPYAIANWNGLKVAIFGLVTYSAKSYPAVRDEYTVLDPMDVARKLVPQLRKQADLVIAVTHDGVDVDRQMAKEIPGIDIIVGGHSHTRLPVGLYEPADSPGPLDPPGTIILQAHQRGGELGKLDFRVTEDRNFHWHISKYSEVLLPITDKIEEDSDVAKVVDSYWDKIKDKYRAVVGQATAEFTDTLDMSVDATNYYLVADAVQDATGVQFDLENREGVRAPILKGPITFGDVVAIDPFNNNIWTFQIKGSDLKKLIAQTRPSTSAALRYTLTAGDPVGKTWSVASATLNGMSVDDNTVYMAATSSYFFNAFAKPYAVSATDTGKVRRNVILEYIRKKGTISPAEDRRNVFDGPNAGKAPE